MAAPMTAQLDAIGSYFVSEPWNFTPEKVMALLHRIIADVRPAAIYAFGSRATGKANERSDLDIAVIVDAIDAEHPRPSLHDITQDFLLEVDYVVLDVASFSAKASWLNTIQREVTQEGLLLYERGKSEGPITDAVAVVASGCGRPQTAAAR